MSSLSWTEKGIVNRRAMDWSRAPSLLPPASESPSQPTQSIPAPLLESPRAAVQLVGELIKDLLTHAPDAVPYLRPYLEASAPTINQMENLGPPR
jgi:hypothetical protein